jgi:predicted transcriptional regulator
MESWKIKFFNDTYVIRIFESVNNSPKSALQISEECNIPRSTVYRKLKMLHEKNLIQRRGLLQNGVKNRIYKKRELPREMD